MIIDIIPLSKLLLIFSFLLGFAYLSNISDNERNDSNGDELSNLFNKISFSSNRLGESDAKKFIKLSYDGVKNKSWGRDIFDTKTHLFDYCIAETEMSISSLISQFRASSHFKHRKSVLKMSIPKYYDQYKGLYMIFQELERCGLLMLAQTIWFLQSAWQNMKILGRNRLFTTIFNQTNPNESLTKRIKISLYTLKIYFSEHYSRQLMQAAETVISRTEAIEKRKLIEIQLSNLKIIGSARDRLVILNQQILNQPNTTHLINK